jgi:hypothetical protein
VKPETLEVPDRVRREIERLEKWWREQRDRANAAEQRAERAGAEIGRLQAQAENAESEWASKYAEAITRAERAEAERDAAQAALLRSFDPDQALIEKLERAEAALRELADKLDLRLTDNAGGIALKHDGVDNAGVIQEQIDKARAIVEGK